MLIDISKLIRESEEVGKQSEEEYRKGFENERNRKRDGDRGEEGERKFVHSNQNVYRSAIMHEACTVAPRYLLKWYNEFSRLKKDP